MTRDAEIDIQSYDYAKYLLFTGFPDNESELTAMRIAFSDGAKWADAHPHWISVDDELPKEHEWILGFSLKRSYIDVYNFDSNGLFEAHDITHWMPFQFPKKGGEE